MAAFPRVFEGTKLKINTGMLDQARQVQNDQQRAYKARRNVGSRNATKRRRADFVDNTSDDEQSWDPNYLQGSTSRGNNRSRNPEISLNATMEDIWADAAEQDPQNWFRVPVPIKTYKDYLTVVKAPMDMGTIKDKLARWCYKSRHEFMDDFRQMAVNAMIYNGQEHVVYKQGRRRCP